MCWKAWLFRIISSHGSQEHFSLSVIRRPVICCISLQAFNEWCESVSKSRGCLRANPPAALSPAGESGWVWNNTSYFRGHMGVKTLLCQERKNKHAVFLLCHIVVLTVIFNMWWLSVKENEGVARRSSRTQLTCLWLVKSASRWCLREHVIWFYTHWFPMCHVLGVFCFVFVLWGGWGWGRGTSVANVKF